MGGFPHHGSRCHLALRRHSEANLRCESLLGAADAALE